MELRKEFEKTGAWLFRWRSYFPLIILPLLLAALSDAEYIERTFGDLAESFWEVFCLGVSFTGLFIRCMVIGFVPRRTSGRNTDGQKAERLNTSGIYSIVRHPLYLGNFLIFIGMALFTQVLWFVIIAVLAFCVYYERIMFAEEKFLRGKFGEEYVRWAERTPAFIPDLRNYEKPALPFSFRNVLNREYTAPLVIIGAFTFMDLIRDILAEGELDLETSWLFALIITLMAYIVLRTLRTKTGILRVEGR